MWYSYTSKFRTHRDLDKAMDLARLANVQFESQSFQIEFEGKHFQGTFQVDIEFRDSWKIVKRSLGNRRDLGASEHMVLAGAISLFEWTWREIHDTLPDPEESYPCCYLGLHVWLDKGLVSTKVKMHPILIRGCWIHSTTRNGSGNGGLTLVGFVTMPPQISHINPKNHKGGERSEYDHLKRRIYREIVRTLAKYHASTSGIARLQTDGVANSHQQKSKTWAEGCAWWTCACLMYHQGGCPPFNPPPPSELVPGPCGAPTVPCTHPPPAPSPFTSSSSSASPSPSPSTSAKNEPTTPVVPKTEPVTPMSTRTRPPITADTRIALTPKGHQWATAAHEHKMMDMANSHGQQHQRSRCCRSIAFPWCCLQSLDAHSYSYGKLSLDGLELELSSLVELVVEGYRRGHTSSHGPFCPSPCPSRACERSCQCASPLPVRAPWQQRLLRELRRRAFGCVSARPSSLSSDI
ncbi:hypothetical protein FB45DRAFT_878738 [Roridomyces roridus]|uniref:Uncharacterized protein n=1 Tax=Roridomyces roridus TaxID=1738132 RepID=A0AAD7F921_9AGAR|nr:hypothetical protein FB45DRAFT_878738 [Roridomyces roridus]